MMIETARELRRQLGGIARSAAKKARDRLQALSHAQQLADENRRQREEIDRLRRKLGERSPPPELDATEAAQSHAKRMGIDLAQVHGTGSGGRILAQDVARAVHERSKSGEQHQIW